MHAILVFLHVTAAILFMGAAMFGTSVFPKAALAAANGDQTAKGTARIAHKASVTYGFLSATVPLFGLTILFTDWATYQSQPQFHTAILLALIAWGLLLFFIVPKQKKLAGLAGILTAGELDSDAPITGDAEKLKKTLTITSGIFNLLWVIALILMYV